MSSAAVRKQMNAPVFVPPVTEAELAATCGLLDPAHSQTPEIIEQVAAVIDRRPSYRTIMPDPEIWREAGVLSGTLARTQGYGREQRRRVLNDALLFATARKYGCAVLSRNVLDFDLLQQLDPSGKVMFYERALSKHLWCVKTSRRW
jgi:predicted nucleic acid-binding protein